jgi:hypothetical protein
LTRRFSLACSALCVAAGSAFWASPAAAFEKQWHLGGGLGAAVPAEFSLGPAANFYGAYGISDVFDVRLEGFVSQNEDAPVPAAADTNPPTARIPGRTALFYGAKLALAYKVDVIEWIPYFGIAAGFLGVVPHGEGEGQDADPAPFAQANATAGAILGLDYAVSRSFALGLGVFGDYALHGAPEPSPDPDKQRRDDTTPLYWSAFLRAEYRFGW